MRVAPAKMFAPLLRALGQRNFAIFAGGNTVSLIGTWMQRIAIGWLAWQLTNSAAWVGLIAFADLFPTVVIGPFAGAFADGWDRLKVIRLGEVLSLVLGTVLFGLSATGLITIEMLLVLTFLIGSAAALNQPARLATIPQLVHKRDAGAAVALNAMIFNMARFIGPAIGGVVIATLGISATFAINVLTFVAFLLALSQIRLEVDPHETRPKGGLFSQLVSGLHHTVHHRVIGVAFVLIITTSILGRSVIELLPAIAGAIYERGAGGLAAFTSAAGLGAMAAGVVVGGGESNAARLMRLLMWTSAALGVVLAIFALSSSFWMAIVTLVLAGFCISASGISVQTLVFLTVEAGMRARVLGFYGVLLRGGPAVGALMLGLISEWLGPGLPMLAAALTIIVMTLLLWRRCAILISELAASVPPEDVAPARSN